jgi:hypothetical protein
MTRSRAAAYHRRMARRRWSKANMLRDRALHLALSGDYPDWERVRDEIRLEFNAPRIGFDDNLKRSISMVIASVRGRSHV